jgi:hypothetical protein
MPRNVPKTILVGILFALCAIPMLIIWLVKPPREMPEDDILNESMVKRDLVMGWWDMMNSAQKTKVCDTNRDIVGTGSRWETLTGREIELLYDEVNKQ